MAAHLGVSEMAVRNAVRRLAEAGELVARRRTGIRVAESGKQAWQAHVLFVYLSDTYYFTARNRHFAHLMNRANIRLTAQLLGGLDNQEDLSKIRTALDCQTVDLVVLDGVASGLISEVVQRGIPFVSTGSTTVSRLAAASLLDDQHPAFAAMTQYCKECGVRSITVISPTNGRIPIIEEAIAEAGLAFAHVAGIEEEDGDGTERIECQGYQAMQQLLQQDELPDAVYITDDYAARGALTALLAAGIKVPEHLQVIIWANKGHCPVFPKPLTRIEVDPQDHAQAYSELVRSVLKTNGVKQPTVVSPRFIIGETTCKRGRKGP